MYILDSLSLTGKTIIDKQQTALKSITSSSKSQEKSGVKNLIFLKVTTTTTSTSATITSNSCAMTTNKCILKQEQHQQQHQTKSQQKNQELQEEFMIQKLALPATLHKIKEMIKNSNENLNDELTVAAIENNTTIADNTMPQEEEQQQQNNNDKYGNKNNTGTERGKAFDTCNCHRNCNNCNDTIITIDHQTTTNVNATTTTTTTSTTAANADENNVRQVAEIMLTNIQNNVDLNTFALPLLRQAEATTTTTTTATATKTIATPITLQNFNCYASSSCYCCSSVGICIKDMASGSSKGICEPLNATKHNYNINNKSGGSGVSTAHNDDDDDDGGGIGKFYHNSNSNNSNNNNVMLNTNSFVTLECSPPLTCENEREQATQNGNESSGNAAVFAAVDDTATAGIIFKNNSMSNKHTMAEYNSTIVREQEFNSYAKHEKNKGDPIGNLFINHSPVDSVLENFEKFLNSFKVDNPSLNQKNAEQQDLIDFGIDASSWPDAVKEPIASNNISEEQICPEGKQHIDNIEKQYNLGNLLYCDLNETLEEQNLLESKEILELTTAELIPTTEAIETAKIIKTITKISEIKKSSDHGSDNDHYDDDYANDNNDKFNTNNLMVDEVNETIAKTPVTCKNVYRNYENNSKEYNDKTCAVRVQQQESCQYINSCCKVVSKVTAEASVPLEIVTTKEICSLSSIENNSPQTQNEIEKSHNLNQSANINHTAANTKCVSISCSTANTLSQRLIPIQTQAVSAEYKNNCHHLQQQQEQERIRDQFTSAYTLRDFAKCLKPSADEDILYTLNFIENENENEKLQKFNFNLNTKNQFHTNEDSSCCENCVFSEKEKVNLKNANTHNFNHENILYNKVCDIKDINDPLNLYETNLKEIVFENKLNCKNSSNAIVKLKDTQFSEVENLSTPKFFHRKNQPTKPNTQKAADDITEAQDTRHTLKELKVCANSNDDLQDIGNFDNELKFDYNEKIYNREKSTQQQQQPLLYLTFVWATKNEGQVVTTRRQGNDDDDDDQGENDIENEKELETGNEKEQRFIKKYSNNNSNIKNVNDEYICSYELAKRILEKTYGTCNKKHVEGSHKLQQLKSVASKQPENFSGNDNNDDDEISDLCKSKNLLDKPKCVDKKLNSRQGEKVLKNHKEYLKNKEKSLTSEKILLENLTKKELILENKDDSSLTSEKCVLQQENSVKVFVGQVNRKNENDLPANKSHEADIKLNNSNLNKTESVYNHDILNLNKRLKGLNETNQNQNINNKNQLLLLNSTINHHHQQTYYNCEEEDHLNLEEFQASQRLKRLLQQHQQIRLRYDTIPTTTTTTATQSNNYKQTTKSLKTEIASNSKELLPKDDLLIRNNKQVVGVTDIETTTTLTKLNSKPTKANKLQTTADCETTLERSSLLLHTNQFKPCKFDINNKNSQEYKEDHTNSNEKKQEQQKAKENLIKKEIKKLAEDKEVEIEKVLKNDKEETQQENVNENKQNSPPSQSFVSKKIVRLSQQQQQQQQREHNKIQQKQNVLLSNPLTEIELTENLQQQQQQQQSNVINKTTEESLQKPLLPTKFCNLNLQHIAKTKQLLQEQQQQQEQNLIEIENPKNCSSSPPCQIECEYKSAFVPTKPQVYNKFIKSLAGRTNETTATATATIPLIPITAATLSEFDTQRFSDFLYFNRLTTSFNNNNYNYKNPNCQITHVLPIQQQQFVIDSIHFPYCYDELFLNETQQQQQEQQLKEHETLNATHTTLYNNNNNNNNNNYTEILDDDLVSLSSNNSSSTCDCINCQQSAAEEIDQSRVRDRVPSLFSIDKNVLLETKQTSSYKMREVNGQLRGLLKKPNRPPATRKNRVVFDETRNEFFEADYIILIREDCAYDEEDEEPCTCGEHELVRLCCEEGCQCNYSTAPATTTDDNRTPQSPKYAPPIEFVDEAALSPPDGYKDNGLKNTIGGALSGHIFGAQHLQQLQVIQRLQQQRAAMLAARNNAQIPPPPPPTNTNLTSGVSANQQSSSSPLNSSSTLSSTGAAIATTVANNNSMNQTGATQQQQQHSPDDDTQGVCTECAECAECAAKQSQQDAECHSPQCQDDLTGPLGVPAVALLPIHTSSPERRMTQKEIIAGEERPRYVLQAQYKSSPVSERRIVREATEDLTVNATSSPATADTLTATAVMALSSGSDNELLPPALPAKPGAVNINSDLSDSEKPPPIPPKESSPTTQISGILKGGKLWKQDSISQQSDDQNNTTSEDEAGSTSNGTIKRSVRFVTEDISNDEVDSQLSNVDEDNQINELIPIKKHSTLFKNALRPNSAVQQLFPSTVSHQTLTSEALRAFDESKRAGCLVSTLPGNASDSDTLRRSMERNILRRSLIKKKAVKSDISLEERIKQLTCGIDEDNDDAAQENCDDENSKLEDNTDLSQRNSPAGEENPQKFNMNGNNSDKSFSPNSSVSSSSSGSSAYKKITEIFNREKKNQEKIMEMEENPIVIIPQECRCPAAPDLGMGVQVPVVHTQIHRTPPRQTEPKRQFLSTLAPLTACVAGNKDDLSSYYTLAAAHHSQAAQNAHAAEYNLAAMMAGEQNTTGVAQSGGDEVRKVAPDVIAGTPGQEPQDELAVFAQQEANRTDKIKKRYGNEPANSKENNNKDLNSDDDEGNDYGFNKRPSVRGIKPKFSSTNEILQQMQDQLSQQMPTVAHSQPLPQPMKSYTLPKQASASAMTKQLTQQQPSPQNVPHPSVATSQQQLNPQQPQMCNAAVAPAAALQIPANAAISQQQTEQRSWSFYSETGGAAEQQRLPVETAASAMQQTYYQTLPAGAMFRHTMIHQHQQHGPEEAMLYAQNCQAMAATIEPQQHYGHYARSPTRRPESPPPLRNYHQTMVLIPYNAETYSQFAATNMDPKVAHIQRQNILEYQQVTQQTIRVPIGYALPGMQLHVVAGRGHTAQYATAASAQTHHHQHQRIMTQRYQFAQEASMAGFSERGVPEGAAAVSHSDCTNSGMVSPTTSQQIVMQQQQQQQQQQHQLQQQGAQLVQHQQQQQQQQQQGNCQQQLQQLHQQQPQPQTQNNMQSAAQGSVYYAMNV